MEPDEVIETCSAILTAAAASTSKKYRDALGG
jgi:hypothetical protein